MGNNDQREYSVPHMMNMSYDKTYQQNTVEVVKLNPSTGTLDRDIDKSALETLIDVASATVTYVGKAAPNTATSAASWQIKKIDSTTNPTSIKFADGVTSFTKVWDNRATFTY